VAIGERFDVAYLALSGTTTGARCSTAKRSSSTGSTPGANAWVESHCAESHCASARKYKRSACHLYQSDSCEERPAPGGPVAKNSEGRGQNSLIRNRDKRHNARSVNAVKLNLCNQWRQRDQVANAKPE
jgi:hypothetical protein